MKRLGTMTPKRAAVLFGAAFAFVFLMLNDPDAMSPVMLDASKWLVLLPAAFMMAMRSSLKPLTSGLCLTGGVFIGACLLALVHGSNIWPIAGVYWSIVWLPPIAVGTVAGALASRLVNGQQAR